MSTRKSWQTLRALVLECRMANQEETNRSQLRADGSHPDGPIGFQKSTAYHLEASAVIAGGVNSNVRLGAMPLCFAKASGSKLFDLDGNEYIDYALGMGPAILGHAPAEVVEAVRDSLGDGQLYAGQHSSELRLAKLLQAHIPSAELVRIGLTGSEMVQAALRVARAYTGRTQFVKFEGQYHGWFDNVLVNTSGPANDPVGSLPFAIHYQSAGQSLAATSETYVLPWNDAAGITDFITRQGSQIAAIITEPMMCNTGVILPRPSYLQTLRSLCDQHGIVLIFDEVITGYRLGLGGAQCRFNVKPDLSIFGKALGGGFPVAALAGRADIMRLFANGLVNHSGTFNSHRVSLAAAIATLERLAADNGSAYTKIEATGTQLIDGIRQIASRRLTNLKVTGCPAVFHTLFTDQPETFDYASHALADAVRQKTLMDALLLKGIRPTSRGTWFVSTAHTRADVERTLGAVDEILGSRS
jgi:glutamate-1-semialdehyde 2,1-aminomutase